MSPLSGPQLLKGAFVHLAGPLATPSVIAFQYNPETLARTLVPAPGNPTDLNPLETIVFTLVLDATDALEAVEASAAQTGVYPLLSAVELLMYPAAQATGARTLFVWGPNRIVPVTVAALRITERLFNPNLSPIQVAVEVTLAVATEDSPAAGSYVAAHVAALNALAASAYSNTLSPLGLTKL